MDGMGIRIIDGIKDITKGGKVLYRTSPYKRESQESLQGQHGIHQVDIFPSNNLIFPVEWDDCQFDVIGVEGLDIMQETVRIILKIMRPYVEIASNLGILLLNVTPRSTLIIETKEFRMLARVMSKKVISRNLQ